MINNNINNINNNINNNHSENKIFKNIENSFWSIVKNKILFRKILSYIDSSSLPGNKLNTFKYEEIVSVEWLLKNSMISLLIDKVKTNQPLSFYQHGNKFEKQFSIFFRFKENNQINREFFKNFFKNYYTFKILKIKNKQQEKREEEKNEEEQEEIEIEINNILKNEIIINDLINQLILNDCLAGFIILIEFEYINKSKIDSKLLLKALNGNAISICQYIKSSYPNIEFDSNIIWNPNSLINSNVNQFNKKINFLINTMLMKSPSLPPSPIVQPSSPSPLPSPLPPPSTITNITTTTIFNNNFTTIINNNNNNNNNDFKYYQHIFNLCIFEEKLNILIETCYTILLLKDGILKRFIELLNEKQCNYCSNGGSSNNGLSLYHQELMEKFVKQNTLKIDNLSIEELEEISKEFTENEKMEIVDNLKILNIKNSKQRNNVKKLFKMVLPFTSTINDIFFQNYFYYQYKFDDEPLLERFYEIFKDYLEFYDVVQKTLEPFYQSFIKNSFENQMVLIEAITHHLFQSKLNGTIKIRGALTNNNINTNNSVGVDLLRLVIRCDNIDLVSTVYLKLCKISLDPFKSEFFQLIKSNEIFDYLYSHSYPKSQFKLYFLFNNLQLLKHFISNYQNDFNQKLIQDLNEIIKESNLIKYYSFELFKYFFENPSLFKLITDNIQNIWSIIKQSNNLKNRFLKINENNNNNNNFENDYNHFNFININNNNEINFNNKFQISIKEFQFFIEYSSDELQYYCFEIFEDCNDSMKLKAIDWVFNNKIEEIGLLRCKVTERELFFYNYYFIRDAFKQILNDNSKSQSRGNQGTCCRPFDELELVFTEIGKKGDIEILKLLLDNYYLNENLTLLREKHLIYLFILGGAALNGQLSIFKFIYENYSFLFKLSDHFDGSIIDNDFNHNPLNPNNLMTIKFIAKIYNIIIERGHINLYFYFDNIIKLNSKSFSNNFNFNLNSLIKKILNFNNLNLITILENKK
ncbi:hypothetical protein ACTFIR_002265 [Dictyostelium discoideum]